jgi:hypothetical protein
MKADELKDRTKQFALRVLKLVAALPKTIEGRAIDPLLAEANELVAIMATSRRSAAANLKSAI